MHPTLQSHYALGMLRRGHRVHGPNLGLLAGEVAGLVGVDTVARMTGRVISSVAGMVGFDFGSVPGLGGGGADPSQQQGSTVSSKFTSQAQKDAAIATDKANIAQAQQAVDSLQAVVDSFRAQLMNVPGGVDENGQAVDSNFQGMADAFIASINQATDKLHQAETVRNTWQAQLAQDQATPISSGGGGAPAPGPSPQPGPVPIPVPQATASAGTPWWKYAVGLAAVGAVGYVAYENY